MKVTLAYRHHGMHEPVKEAEIPGLFADYATPTGEADAYRIDEERLLSALPASFLPAPPSQVLLMVDEGPWCAGQTRLTRFRPWAKYFDTYILYIACEEPGPVAEESPQPAGLLRRAAARLRETAAEVTPGTWVVERTNRSVWVMADRGLYVANTGTSDIDESPRVQADAEWIALASPAIAEPLAAWLESEQAVWGEDATPPSLAIARAVLGETGA